MHLEKYPHANVIDLGIGDTTEPLSTIVTSSMVDVSYKGSFCLVITFFSLYICWSLYSLMWILVPAAKVWSLSFPCIWVAKEPLVISDF